MKTTILLALVLLALTAFDAHAFTVDPDGSVHMTADEVKELHQAVVEQMKEIALLKHELGLRLPNPNLSCMEYQHGEDE